MRFNGGRALPWSRMEKILSGAPTPTPVSVEHLDGPATAAPQGLSTVPFAELHATSAYSFLDGAAEPEAMVARARELGLSALSILDRDGFYGAMKFADAAAEAGLPTVFGAELTLGNRLAVLARGPEGYRRLSRLIADARMGAGEKGEVSYPDLPTIASRLGDAVYYLIGPEWANQIESLIDILKVDRMVLEYPLTMTPEDADRHAVWDNYPTIRGVVSARPGAATRDEARLATAKRALATRDSLLTGAPNLHPMGAGWLRSGEQVARMLPGRPELMANTVALAEECAFSWGVVAPNLPHFDVPEGHTEMSWLTHLTYARAEERYASRAADIQERARQQIAHELAVIEELTFPGYFLIVCDLVDFCKRENILCQGRGSAANSAVCFALGITNAEPITAGLLFERFLSPDREGPPDIDIDIESTRREEVIQYVFDKHGRDKAAQVANVITYRRKGATRDAARALGYPQGMVDAWSKGTAQPPRDVVKLAEQFLGQPRHLGIHSGGMVLCDRPIADVVPTEWARMEGRSVVQWDKDDCAAAGLVKFDLLGLGMLEALHHMIDLVKETTGETINLWELDLAEEAVYDMLCRADAVGVFQVESRAQLSTLPRLKPRIFFDLVVEVALIRPGPIQGGSVHPYLRRRDGREPVTFDHPVLEKSLGKTLGIPLFQEQLMQVAIDAAGFTGAEADDLRRAMGSKRSPQKMAALKDRFYTGLRTTNNITGETADKLWNKVVAFAAYGFPESHSQSFASLVFFSAWFKLHYPAEFCVGLLRAQPMGFYSPQSLIQDARRHGVTIHPVSINHSAVEATIESGGIRIGLGLIKGLSDAAAARIADAAPFQNVADLARRAEVSVQQVEALADAGALDCLGIDRRQALWQAGIAATEKPGMLPGLSAISAPALPGMTQFELLAADIAATGVTHDKQPMELIRAELNAQGILTAAQLKQAPDGMRIKVAGVVTHRQRPQTASGLTFFGMEDETGLINVMVSPGLWQRHRVVARTAKALIVRGIVQNATGAVNVVADRLDELPLADALSRGSRDFR
ncbi:error-prone DNA polymerase [Corynebacterium incognita]|uniref:Error-prone DNA polymerase n=1 Tax=Corynebacterium incognita TaxID=2754725 RepID=A0A7G7CN26_9CORY|nr:error-prone DNA polymerase [Corynebacterium incognita]QNE88992.1 error-prone DNA polymerase [Corynebacterium incognita]